MAERRPGGIFCPECRAMTTIDDETGVCLFCGSVVLAGKVRPGPRGPGARYMSARVVVDAYELYLSGLSLRACGKAMLERTRYKNAQTCANMLAEQWRLLGWPLRDRIAATRAASWKHGLLPRYGPRDPGQRARNRRASGSVRGVMCAAVKTRYGKGRGEPCQHFALTGGLYCRQHEPTLAEARSVELALMRARSSRSLRLNV